MAFATTLQSRWTKAKDSIRARATQHTCVAVLVVLQLALVVIFGWVYCSPGKNATIFTAEYEFADMLQKRNAMAELGSDLLAKVDNDGGNVLSAAQAQASSVVQEASSVVTEISKAISKPTLVANMTAEKACLEILSFSKCRETKIGAVFVLGFCFLACAAAATTVMFFCKPHRPARVFGWLAIASGIIAIVVLEGIAVSAWIVFEVVSSILTEATPDSNGRSIYLTFTCIAFFSVAICIIAHHHRSGGTFGGWDKQFNNNSSKAATNVSIGSGKPSSERNLHGKFIPIRHPDHTHPSQRPHPDRDPERSGSSEIVGPSEGNIPVAFDEHRRPA